MLKKITGEKQMKLTAADLPHVRIRDAAFPAPFRSGLEYSSPARGTWNIVHTGMLIPEAHEIYVCAAGCLRGVVLTAAEMGAMDRFSSVAVREHDLLDGDMEELVIEGVTDILGKLPKRPPAVLVHTSCIHHFTGTDTDHIYRTLRERFPDIDFADCYMNPIMRKSGLTPDQLMRAGIYKPLHRREKIAGSVSIVGSDLPTDEYSDLMEILRGSGFKVHEITSCRTYDEYQQIAESPVFVSYYPDAAPGADMLAERIGGTHYALKFSFDYDETDETFRGLADVLGIAPRSSKETAKLRDSCEAALAETGELIGSTPVAIDYTFSPRPLGLAALLLDHGFNVTKVYLDAVSAGDKPSFDYLKETYPELLLCPTVHADMRFAQTANTSRSSDSSNTINTSNTSESSNAINTSNKSDEAGFGDCRVIAIGQKAAYFEGTEHFVNIAEGGGMNGYEAVLRTCALIQDAYRNKKPMRELIQIKGLGCDICIR